MKKNLKKLVFGASAGLSYLYWGVMPVFAAPATASLCPEGTYSVLCTGTSNVSIPKLVELLINSLFFIAFVAALGYLIYGGIKWIMSGGDKEGTAKAKASVTAALVGLAIVLGSYILISLIMQFFGMSGGFGALTAPSLNNALKGG